MSNSTIVTNTDPSVDASFPKVTGTTVGAKHALDVAIIAGGSGSSDVNVTNGSGASAVNIQDGGNSITVDMQDTSNSGNITANGQSVTTTIQNKSGGVLTVTGTFVGTFVFEGSPDGVTYFPSASFGGSTNTIATGGTGADSGQGFLFNFAGFSSFRVRSTAWTSGTATFKVYATTASSAFTFATLVTSINPIPINDNGGSLTVDGTIATTQSGNWSVRSQDGSGNSLTSHSAGSSRGIDVSIIDGSGNQITSFGGGVQYTEDVASASDPTGTQLIARRRDSLSTETTDDGDNTAVNSTAKGELYVKHIDAIPVTDNGGSLTVDGTVAVSGSVAVTGPLTDTQLRATAVPVSGTIAATQSGTWTVQPGNTANTTAWKVDGSAVTQPISAAALPLPSGASTAAKQPALGTAGTASADVITVQGIASMTALKVDGSGVTQPVSGSVTVTQATGTNLHTVIDSGTVSTITNVVHVDDNSGSLTVDNGGTFAVQATVAAAATNIAKAEDVASADGDVGVPSMAIRKATPANTSGIDGDYEMLQMSAGRLWVDPSGVTLTVASHAVTVASGGIASGALASGSVASGAVASGAVASGAFAAGSIAAGAVAAGATSFVKLEDVASADADAGVPAMAVRKATPANTSSTDGDYEMLQMSAGRLWASATVDNASGASAVNIQDGGNSITVDGAVTVSGAVTANQGGAWTVTANAGTNLNTSALALDTSVNGLLLAQDGSATSKTGPMVQGRVSTADPSLVSGNTNPLSLNTAGYLRTTTLVPASANSIGKQEDAASADGDTGVGCLAVQKATPANTAGEGDYAFLQMSAGRLWASTILEAGTAAIGKLAANSGVDIGDIDVTSIVPGTAATNLGKAEDVAHASGDVGVMALAVANEANTVFAADGDYVPLGTDREGSNRTIGNRAHDAVDSGAPVKVGLKAVAHGSTPTEVSAADRTDWYANRAGIPFVIGGHMNLVTLRLAITGANTNVAVITVSAGTKIVVTMAQVTSSYANLAFPSFRVGFATATTPTTTGVVMAHDGLAPGSGFSVGNGSGIVGIGADDEDLRITNDDPTGTASLVVKYYTVSS